MAHSKSNSIPENRACLPNSFSIDYSPTASSPVQGIHDNQDVSRHNSFRSTERNLPSSPQQSTSTPVWPPVPSTRAGQGDNHYIRYVDRTQQPTNALPRNGYTDMTRGRSTGKSSMIYRAQLSELSNTWFRSSSYALVTYRGPPRHHKTKPHHTVWHA